MLHSLRKQTGYERPKDKRTNKNKNKKLWDYTHSPRPYTLTLMWINHPPPIPSPIIHNNKTMDTEFPVQMRQSNTCGSVRNDEIFNLHLGSGACPWVSIPCLLQDTSHIYWFHPPKQLTRKKQEPKNEIQLPANCIALPWSTYTEPRSKRGRLGTQP